MMDNMKRYIRTGIIHFMAYPQTMKGEGPVLETLEKIAADSYFDAVEITWIKDPDTRRKAAEMLKASHMTVYYGAQPRLLTTGLNINDLDETGRLQAVAMLKDGIDEAYEVGAVGFAFLSGPYQEETKEDSFNALLKSTGELCRYARSKGDLKIVHEIFDYDVDKKSLIGPAGLATRYADEISADYDNFGLMADLSHLPLIRETSAEALLPIKDYLVHIHIGNCVSKPGCPGYGDQHPRFGFPGGDNDAAELRDFLKTLLDIGYLNGRDRRTVSFEVKPFGDESPEMVIAGAKRVLDEAWARL